ncbi:MAG: transposase [Deltaproteobacteria bacterium]|nr:transposase [Deltaproteobacteria bacterium]
MKPKKGSVRLRKGRHDAPGLYYALTAITAGRQPFFENPSAARAVLSSMQWLAKSNRIILEAGVIMPDHFHMVVRLGESALSEVMHSLKGYSAKHINQAWGRSGPVWQHGYHDHAVRQDEDLNAIIRYCLNNPVRAGLVDDFHDYPFWYCRYGV